MAATAAVLLHASTRCCVGLRVTIRDTAAEIRKYAWLFHKESLQQHAFAYHVTLSAQ
jgi:hypothetical protein